MACIGTIAHTHTHTHNGGCGAWTTEDGLTEGGGVTATTFLAGLLTLCCLPLLTL
jgi:hypothetical protein